MPENKSENAIIPDGITPDGEAVPEAAGAEAVQAENAWEQFERGRLSRRQALKKLGMTSAMATFALFSVDDLARMVGKAMQQRAQDNKVVEQIAQEFQQAGVAFAADTISGLPTCGYYTFPHCWNCCHHLDTDTQACVDQSVDCKKQGHTDAYCSQQLDACNTQTKNTFDTCMTTPTPTSCMCEC